MSVGAEAEYAMSTTACGNASLVEFSLCLSRACLGKINVFSINDLKKGVSAHRVAQPHHGGEPAWVAPTYSDNRAVARRAAGGAAVVRTLSGQREVRRVRQRLLGSHEVEVLVCE